MNTSSIDQPAVSQDPNPNSTSGPQPLQRPINDRMLAGVAAGIAGYLRIDVTIVRIVIVVLTLVGGAGLALYVAGWLLIPEEGSQQSIAAEFLASLQARSR